MIRSALATLAAAALVTAAPFPAQAAAPTKVAITIGGTVSCVPWHSGITGDEIINDVASVRYRNDGLLTQINGVPSNNKADNTHYWSYWHSNGTGGSFSYSSVGQASYTPAAGTVEGWSFDNGQANATPPPLVTYAAACGTTAAKPAPAPAPAPVTKAATTGRTSTRNSPPGTTTTDPTPPPSSRGPVTGVTSPARRTAATVASTAATVASTAGTGTSTTDTSTPTPAPALSPVAASAARSGGSPVPVVFGGGLVLALAAGAGVAAWRRPRA